MLTKYMFIILIIFAVISLGLVKTNSLREFVIKRCPQKVVQQQEAPPLHLSSLPMVLKFLFLENTIAKQK